jgi:hypothetical protein
MTTPQTHKAASGGSMKLVHRFLECLKTKWVFVLFPLVLSGCTSTTGGKVPANVADDLKTPQYQKLSEADRASLKGKPDYAMVAGSTAKRLNSSGELSVYLSGVDRNSFSAREWVGTQFVSAGTRRVVVNVEGTGLIPGEFLPPEIEVTFLAQHFYHITAKQIDKQDLIQVWDETEGTAKRTLVKEWRGELPNVRWQHSGDFFIILLPALIHR